jgi:negative regulator of sigma E activity
METKKNSISTRRIRAKVNDTHAFLALNKVQRDIVNTGQNITAIYKGLEEVKTNGVLHWETFSQNSRNNAEIIREIYTNSLEVKF